MELCCSIDPLAELTLLQDQIHQRLMDLTPTDSLDLQRMWQEAQATIDSVLDKKPEGKTSKHVELQEEFYVLVTCCDEKHQIALLTRFHAEGLECKALLS
jgi:hypothetical protein